MLIKPEESHDSGLELELGLTLVCAKPRGETTWTAKELDSEVSSSSSSSSVAKTGTKRTAPPRRQVVGWPPIRACRLNSNQLKPFATRDFFSKAKVMAKINKCAVANANLAPKEKGLPRMSSFLKVNMDGVPFGRKVNLNGHTSYAMLGQSLDEMFEPSLAAGMNDKHCSSARRSLGLFDESSEHVLTYKDKDGDWMLVGDVPWDMFCNSVRRLWIMKRTDVNGIASSMPIGEST